MKHGACRVQLAMARRLVVLFRLCLFLRRSSATRACRPVVGRVGRALRRRRLSARRAIGLRRAVGLWRGALRRGALRSLRSGTLVRLHITARHRTRVGRPTRSCTRSHARRLLRLRVRRRAHIRVRIHRVRGTRVGRTVHWCRSIGLGRGPIVVLAGPRVRWTIVVVLHRWRSWRGARVDVRLRWRRTHVHVRPRRRRRLLACGRLRRRRRRLHIHARLRRRYAAYARVGVVVRRSVGVRRANTGVIASGANRGSGLDGARRAARLRNRKRSDRRVAVGLELIRMRRERRRGAEVACSSTRRGASARPRADGSPARRVLPANDHALLRRRDRRALAYYMCMLRFARRDHDVASRPMRREPAN